MKNKIIVNIPQDFGFEELKEIEDRVGEPGLLRGLATNRLDPSKIKEETKRVIRKALLDYGIAEKKEV